MRATVVNLHCMRCVDVFVCLLTVVSSLRSVPKPGYGLKASTLPATGRNGGSAGMAVSISEAGLTIFFFFQDVEM